MNKSGFTLLEILVVIIIVGVLASVAMPTLFRNVERSRATEALNTLGTVRRQMTGCSMQFNSFATCSTFNQIGMADPSNGAGNGTAHFNYGISGVGAAAYTITATRVALDNGNSGDLIDLILGGGVVTRSGTTNFAGIQ